MNREAQWNSASEQLVKSIGEKSLSLQWLHNKSEELFNYYSNFLAIPSIIISTIAGAGSIGFGDEGRDASLILGSLSIAVSIISTLNSYFAFAKRAENHRITAVSYSKLYLQISIEMSLPRDKRTVVKEFIKNISEQIQRLNEVQPSVHYKVIEEYRKTFKDEPETIAKPEMCNGLAEIRIFSGKEENIIIEPVG